jgi:NADH-quinone oxidoreductase subunit J
MGELAFLALAVVTLGGALGVVSARSVFVSALWLVVSFVGVAGLYLALDAAFLGIIQVLVYVGAISVLILFAVMLTPNLMETPAQLNRQTSLSLAVALLVFGALAMVSFAAQWPVATEARVVPPAGVVLEAAAGTPVAPYAVRRAAADGTVQQVLRDPTTMLGQSFVSDQLLAFEVISVILLVALLGAIVIARE